jgi:hypothetical protein
VTWMFAAKVLVSRSELLRSQRRSRGCTTKFAGGVAQPVEGEAVEAGFSQRRVVDALAEVGGSHSSAFGCDTKNAGAVLGLLRRDGRRPTG